MNITEIKLNNKNPRYIKDDKFELLKKSISEFPKMLELRPIIIDDNNMILAGNMRFRALKELGYKEIPETWIKKASELTEEEKKRFIITDNNSFGDWDMDMLANEWNLDELKDWGTEITNFNQTIDEIIEEAENFDDNLQGKEIEVIFNIQQPIYKNIIQSIKKKIDFESNTFDNTERIAFLIYSNFLFDYYKNKFNRQKYYLQVPVDKEYIENLINKKIKGNETFKIIANDFMLFLNERYNEQTITE